MLWDVFRCNDIGQDVLKAVRQRWGLGRLRGAPGHPTRTRSRPAPLPPPPSPLSGCGGPGCGDGWCPSPPAPRPPRVRLPHARPAPALLLPRAPPPRRGPRVQRRRWRRVGRNSSASGQIAAARLVKFVVLAGSSNSFKSPCNCLYETSAA
jgi:hypothetical protein